MKLSILITDTKIIVNPDGRYSVPLPAVYVGRACKAQRLVQEGKVNVEKGVVSSASDETKAYVYDPTLVAMVECHRVWENETFVFRRVTDEFGNAVVSQGYQYEDTNPDTNKTRTVRLAYDSHHLAWLIAQGCRLEIQKTPWAAAALPQHLAFSEMEGEERRNFKWQTTPKGGVQ